MKLKAYLQAGSLSNPSHESFYGGSAPWHLLDLSRLLGWSQLNQPLLRSNSLRRASSSPVIIPSPKMAVIHARS